MLMARCFSPRFLFSPSNKLVFSTDLGDSYHQILTQMGIKLSLEAWSFFLRMKHPVEPYLTVIFSVFGSINFLLLSSQAYLYLSWLIFYCETEFGYHCLANFSFKSIKSFVMLYWRFPYRLSVVILSYYDWWICFWLFFIFPFCFSFCSMICNALWLLP